VEIQLPAGGPAMPVHPYTGLTAIGLRLNGAPIWPVRGGAEDGDGAGDGGDAGDGTGGGDQGGDAGADQLGDAGKRALDAMKGKWQTERDQRKSLQAEIDRLKTGQGKPDEGKQDGPDLAKVREEAAAAARAETMRERVLDKIEARAAKLFADPEDASALLARRIDEFIDGGKVDVEAIGEALTELLAKKPHLGVAKTARFEGGADGGARKGSGPAQVTEQDLKRMSPEAIEKARIEGRLNDLLGIKTE
jgi:hypothetical protein